MREYNIWLWYLCRSGHPSSTLLLLSPQWRQRFAVLPRQYDDFTELYVLARQATAVLVGPGLASISPLRLWWNSRGVLSSGTLAPTTPRGDGGGWCDPLFGGFIPARDSGRGVQRRKLCSGWRGRSEGCLWSSRRGRWDTFPLLYWAFHLGRTFKVKSSLWWELWRYNGIFLLASGGASSDEMEKLYIHLKEASLSPIGHRKPSTKREFRASFIKRCKNQTVNDRLHLIRTLNSTLKVHFFFIYTPLKIVPDS